MIVVCYANTPKDHTLNHLATAQTQLVANLNEFVNRHFTMITFIFFNGGAFHIQ